MTLPMTPAMEAADNALPCLCECSGPMEGQHTTPCPKVYAPDVAEAIRQYTADLQERYDSIFSVLWAIRK